MAGTNSKTLGRISGRIPLWGAVLVLLTVAGLFGCGSQSGPVGRPAPAIALPDLAGRTVSLADFSGRVVMLNFFATWCPPCKQEIPDFVDLQAELGEAGLTILAVSLDKDSVDKVREFSLANKINYPVLYAGGQGDDIVYQMGNFRGIPTTFLIDRQGTVVKQVVGAVSKETWLKELKKLL